MRSHAPYSKKALPFALLVGAVFVVGGVHTLAKEYFFELNPGKTPPGIDYKNPAVVKAPNFGGKNGLRFAMFGDWGMKTSMHRLVADGLFAFQSRLKKSDEGLTAVLLAGDNFYSKGVKGLDDPKWEELWGRPFRRVQVPFYVSLGNHDYGFGADNAQLQVHKSGTKGFEHWICRDDNGEDEYGIYFSQWFVSEKVACQVVFIDTSLLLVAHMRAHNKWGDQLHWLAKRLDDKPPKGCEKKAITRLVIGHHVIRCFGEKEREVVYINHDVNRVGPNKTTLYDIVQEKADAYLCGHAHTVEYIHLGGADVAPKKGPIHGKERALEGKVPLQLLSGTGASTRQTSYWDKSCYYVNRIPGFTVISLDPTESGTVLRAHFVDCRKGGKAEVIYSLKMPLAVKTASKKKKKLYK